ncbi:Hypothetical predicted protein [Mytilus galloprovincialis]|uniref:Short-chain collagen C4-like n=1 Tax=Mytilus galloprovincialis TaxID=29158 RepID=A0A8B6HSS4_MYTGA|nr:Hypothetical predicted protein [Mytilus galloprovincialis]
MGYLQVFINAVVVALMAMYVYENERKREKMSTRHYQTVFALEKKLQDMRQLLSTKSGIEKLTEIENQQLKLQDKGVTYIRWGKTKCDGSNTETIYSGQVGGGHQTHSGASVNYICLPNNPDVAHPLKSHDHYGYLYEAEFEVFDFNQPQGIRSGIGQHEVACSACLTKGKLSSILIPGKKTCYNGWTKEYEGILMSGYHGHAVASEFVCVDRDTEAIAGGSKNENGRLFYPVKTRCGSLKCPPYAADTEVLCFVCSK